MILGVCLKNKLPYRSKFFSSLKVECFNEKDYLKAVDVWNVFKMKTMGDYHDRCLFKDKGFIISWCV